MEVKWEKDENGKMQLKELPGSNHTLDAELVLFSMGFVHPVHEGLIKEINLECDNRGNIAVNDNFQTNNQKVFAAGDSSTGASLVVTAIFNGRQAAERMDEFLEQ